MRKFIVLFALLFLAGFTAAAWAASSIGSGNNNSPAFQSSTGTQADQGQVAGQLKGEGENQSGDHKNLFPKSQLGKKKFSSKAKSLDDKHKPGVKGKFDHKGEIKGQKKGFLKGEKGFLKHKTEKGFHKGEKGFLKGEKGKANEIDDEVTWGKNEMKGKTMQKSKGFLKLHDPAGTVGGAQVPVAK